MYQKVPISQTDAGVTYSHRRRQRLESSSNPGHHQPLQPHDDFSSDGSDESHSISSSSILETRELQHDEHRNTHHRNYQHVAINKTNIEAPTSTTEIPARFTISRRSSNSNGNTSRYIPPAPTLTEPILQETQSQTQVSSNALLTKQDSQL